MAPVETTKGKRSVPCVLMQTWRHPRSPDPPRVMVRRSAWQIVSSTLDSTQRVKFIGISVKFSLGAKYKNPERKVLGRPRAPLVPVLFPEWGEVGVKASCETFKIQLQIAQYAEICFKAHYRKLCWKEILKPNSRVGIMYTGIRQSPENTVNGRT
jgi:hypothetical protein